MESCALSWTRRPADSLGESSSCTLCTEPIGPTINWADGRGSDTHHACPLPSSTPRTMGMPDGRSMIDNRLEPRPGVPCHLHRLRGNSTTRTRNM